MQPDANEVQQALGRTAPDVTFRGSLAAYNRLAADWTAYKAVGTSALKLAERGTPAGIRAADSLYFAKAVSLNDALDQQVAQLVKINDAQATKDKQAISANETSSTTLTIVILVLSILIGAAVSVLVARSISRNVSLASSSALSC